MPTTVQLSPVPRANEVVIQQRLTPFWFDWLNRLRDALLLLNVIHIVTGSPNGSEYGSVGHIALRLDGGAGTTLYVKESGTNTNTGWVGK